MTDKLTKCAACDGRGYFYCDCHPADCICGVGEDTCDECGGEGIVDPSYEYLDTPPPQPNMRGAVSLLEAATFLLWHKDRGRNTEDCVEAWEALRSAVAAAAMPGSKCGICDGPHDNDALTDICTSCEARINDEGSP